MLLALSTLLRLFAPFLPFVTEEVWSWWQAGRCIARRGRQPTSCWRRSAAAMTKRPRRWWRLPGACEVRKKKSEEKKPLRTPVISATIRAPRDNLDLLDQVWRDVSASGVFQVTPTKEESASFESAYELGEPEARS
jgi:valyl-tRNA synthetase